MKILSSHEQWPAVLEICKTLKASGHLAYVAGGAVRDALLGRIPNDIDIATEATPEQVEGFFERVIMVGKQFGVCQVVVENQGVELATFRKDGHYKDGRRPEGVLFSSPKEDAQRRDFTINGLFYDLDTGKIFDFVDGQKDLRARVLRAIGDPQQRFEEDRLRILRGLRFFSQLQFPLTPETAKAMAKAGPGLKTVSQERVTAEWGKLLMGAGVLPALALTHELGIWAVIFEDWPFLLEGYKALFTDDIFNEEQIWALWFLIHWRDDPAEMKRRMIQWKLPKGLMEKSLFVLQNLDVLSKFQTMPPVDIALFLNQDKGIFAAEIFPHLNVGVDLVAWAQSVGGAQEFFSEDGQLAKPLVSGKDLMAKGYQGGPKMARLLAQLYRKQLQDRLTSKERVMEALNGIEGF